LILPKSKILSYTGRGTFISDDTSTLYLKGIRVIKLRGDKVSISKLSDSVIIHAINLAYNFDEEGIIPKVNLDLDKFRKCELTRIQGVLNLDKAVGEKEKALKIIKKAFSKVNESMSIEDFMDEALQFLCFPICIITHELLTDYILSQIQVSKFTSREQKDLFLEHYSNEGKPAIYISHVPNNQRVAYKLGEIFLQYVDSEFINNGDDFPLTTAPKTDEEINRQINSCSLVLATSIINGILIYRMYHPELNCHTGNYYYIDIEKLKTRIPITTMCDLFDAVVIRKNANSNKLKEEISKAILSLCVSSRTLFIGLLFEKDKTKLQQILKNDFSLSKYEDKVIDYFVSIFVTTLVYNFLDILGIYTEITPDIEILKLTWILGDAIVEKMK
jgi:hypothetical protein